MRDRLIELIDKADEECKHSKSCKACSGYGKGSMCMNYHIADYLLANGVIILPCKVGDVVYTNINGTGLQNSFLVNSVDLLGFSNGLYSWTWHQLGKSVFLTLKDAQNALKDGEG